MFARQVVGVGIILGLLYIGAVALPAELPASKSADKPQSSEFRTWTDITGKFKTEAAFVDLKDGKVRLQKKDGIIISPPIDNLSEADQEWVKGRTKKPGPPVNPNENVTTPRSKSVWAQIVREYVDDADSKKSAEIACLATQVFNQSDSVDSGQNIESLWKKRLSIEEITHKYGGPDRKFSERKKLDASSKEIEFEYSVYGPVALGVKKGKDEVCWFVAPHGWWRVGIRAKAEEELRQSSGSAALAQNSGKVPSPFKVKISWEKEVSAAIEFSDAPFILYEKSPLFAAKEALMRVRANYRDAQGKVVTGTCNQLVPVEIRGQKGRIESRLWIFLSKTSFQVFASLEGTGNIEVALFEAVRKPGVANPEHGTQLSNWISLPEKLPSLKGGFKL